MTNPPRTAPTPPGLVFRLHPPGFGRRRGARPAGWVEAKRTTRNGWTPCDRRAYITRATSADRHRKAQGQDLLQRTDLFDTYRRTAPIRTALENPADRA